MIDMIGKIISILNLEESSESSVVEVMVGKVVAREKDKLLMEQILDEKYQDKPKI
jgi:hypothetical protein